MEDGNWIHNANYEGDFRVRGGKIEFRKAPAEGQWGLSMDSRGRFYRNSNEDPLHVDLLSSHYAARSATSASATSVRGLYEELTPNTEVWPAHATPAVNRGYQPQVLRGDGTLRRYTSASSPTAYVGDRLPSELRDNIFVTEPAANLVGRFIVNTTPDGLLAATSGPERPSFLASTDTRSRPVFTTTAPDGTLYVVDMYRGIIQHRPSSPGISNADQPRGLERPVGLAASIEWCIDDQACGAPAVVTREHRAARADPRQSQRMVADDRAASDRRARRPWGRARA